jgi:1-aminocyclopropane-1-carboxylate deaminase/D-cysteine desulfhydrase-like pyridoxal-dependent ACC family enzyme
MGHLMPSPALFDAFPALADLRRQQGRIGHRSLGQFPTPIERVGVLGSPGSGCELWVKREDLAGSLYGGNKVRKLEFLLSEQSLQGPGRRLLTVGAYASNHVLATGMYGRLIGVPVEAVLYPQPITPWVKTAFMVGLGAGIRLHICRSYLGVPWALLKAWRHGPAPYFLPPGGANPLGTLGWWSGGLEIAAQVASGMAPPFDAVYVPLGSGATSAGLLLGLGTAAAELVAVRVVPWPVASALGVKRLASRTRALLTRLCGQAPPPFPQARLRVEGRFLGQGYGYLTPWGTQAIERAAGLGLVLEPIYTGKAFAALLADAESGRLAGKRVLFVQTNNSRTSRKQCRPEG